MKFSQYSQKIYLIRAGILSQRPEEGAQLLGVDCPVSVLVEHGEHRLVERQLLRSHLYSGAKENVSSSIRKI